jgi:hypothetical protein
MLMLENSISESKAKWIDVKYKTGQLNWKIWLFICKFTQHSEFPKSSGQKIWEMAETESILGPKKCKEQ